MTRDRSGWLVRRNAAQAAIWKAEGTWPGLTLADHARAAAAEVPDHVMLIDGDRSVTAAEIYASATRTAKAMIASGLVPGDVISLQLPNWHEAAIINLAAGMAGLVVNPIIPIYRGAELAHILTDSRSRMLFMPGVFRGFDYRDLARDVFARLTNPPEAIVLRGDAEEFTAFDDFVARSRDDIVLPETKSSDVMMVLYTSGTTGPAKGVLHTHDAGDVMVRDYERPWGPWAGETLVVASPLTHITGAIQVMFLPIQLRATVVLMDVWDPHEALRLLKKHNGTFFGGATPFLRGLLDVATEAGEHLPALRILASGGTAVPPGLIWACHDYFPSARVFRAYGCSEVPCATEGARSRADIAYGAETDGWIGATDIRLVRPGTDEPVADGEDGEILGFGAQMFVGYSHPENNEGVFTDDGYFRTGDLGRIRDGYLTITGRIKDLIIRNGENLSAKEIEDALEDMPAIVDIAIIGLPSEKTGEAVCAVIVVSGPAPDLAAIAAHLSAKGLARQKIPERIAVVAELPRNASGKVRKDLLRANMLKPAEASEGAAALVASAS